MRFNIVIILVFVITGSVSCREKKSNVYDYVLTQADLEEKDDETDSVTRIGVSQKEMEGMRLFMKHCNRCHPGGEKGEGPSLVDQKLPDFLIHFQVRNGLGDMPSFKKEELPKEDVRKIISFIHLLRRNTR